jgi:hypothetical protein
MQAVATQHVAIPIAKGTRKIVRCECICDISSASHETDDERMVERLAVITRVVTTYPVRIEE